MVDIITNENWPIEKPVYIIALSIGLGFILKEALSLKKFVFFSNYILVINAKGENVDEIYYNTIEKVVENTRINRSIKTYNLIIHYNGKKLKIDRSNYIGYNQIKEELIKGTGRPIVAGTVSDIEGGVGVMIFGSILIVIALIVLMASKKILIDDTIEVTFIQKNQPVILETSGRSSYKYIKFNADEYPGYNFEISGNPYDVLDTKLYLDSVEEGDTLQMFIFKEDYLSKLQKTKAPEFLTRHNEFGDIDVLALRKGKLYFSKIDDYLLEYRKYQRGNIFGIGGIGALILCIGLLLYANKRAEES